MEDIRVKIKGIYESLFWGKNRATIQIITPADSKELTIREGDVLTFDAPNRIEGTIDFGFDFKISIEFAKYRKNGSLFNFTKDRQTMMRLMNEGDYISFKPKAEWVLQ